MQVRSPCDQRSCAMVSEKLHQNRMGRFAIEDADAFNPLLNGAELEENLEVPMFNIYAGGQTANQIMKNIELAIDIASSSEGFSCEYINQDNPFILLFTIPKENSSLMSKIQTIIDQIQDKHYPLELVYTVLEG